MKLCVGGILCMLLSVTHEGQSLLTVSPAGPVCPGILMNFTCSTSMSYMRWTANHRGQSIPQVAFSTSTSETIQYRGLSNGGQLITATLISKTSGLVSNLSIVTTTDLNGFMAQCVSIGASTVTEYGAIQIVEPPSSPSNLRIVDVQKELFYVIISLEWSPPANSSASSFLVNYTTTSDWGPGSTSTWSTVIESTSKALRVPYNSDITVSVTALNCAGSSSFATQLSFNIVNCSSPPAMDGVIVEPYNDTTEGAMIYFHCSTESTNEERKRVVCGSHGTWSPHSMEDTMDCTIHIPPTIMNTTGDNLEKDEITKCNTTCNTVVTFGITVLVGIGSAGVVIGAVIACFLVSMHKLLIGRRCLKKQDFEVNNNVAYETVNIQIVKGLAKSQ